MKIRCMLDILVLDGFSGFNNVWVVEAKKEKFNRLCGAIIPYIAENLRPYIM